MNLLLQKHRFGISGLHFMKIPSGSIKFSTDLLRIPILKNMADNQPIIGALLLESMLEKPDQSST